MKKTLIIIMIFAILLSFSSCSKPHEEDAPAQNIVDTTNKPTDTDEEIVPDEQPEIDDKAETEVLTEDNEQPTEDSEDIPVVDDGQIDQPDTEQADPPVNDEAEESDGEIYFPTKNADNVSAHASVIGYESTADLYSGASNIVVATVTSHGKKANIDGRVPITVSSLKVEKVLKGSLSEGDAIYVHETGQISEKYDVSVEGIPLLKKKMKVLLYLIGPTDYYIGEDSYGICGVYQGKFFYDNDGYVHSAIDFAESKLPPLSDFKEPMKEADVLSAIEAIK